VGNIRVNVGGFMGGQRDIALEIQDNEKFVMMDVSSD